MALAKIKPTFGKSSAALKLCIPNYDQTISYKVIHVINSRATLPQICHYKHSLMFNKKCNDPQSPSDWMQLYFNQGMSRRQ
jgi:hypothetical protein